MGRKLFIAESIGVDEDLLEVAAHDPLAQLLWPWLLTALDDWGRGSASGQRLKAAVCPANPLVTPEVIEHALGLYASVGLIALYEVSGQRCWAVRESSWWRYQTHIALHRRIDGLSQHPAPPGRQRMSEHAVDAEAIRALRAEPRPLSRSAARRQFQRYRGALVGTLVHGPSRSCAQCGATTNLEVDHIVPLARAGSNDPDNLQWLCRPCNRAKGAREEGRL